MASEGGDVSTVVLFAGAGGSTEGVEDAGYTDTEGFDYWQPALDDLIPGCDLLWASPPCQPFSAAGDGNGEFDDRDGFPWTLRIIAKRLPAVVLIENVKGLTFEKHSEYFGSVLQSLTALGYEWEWKVLNSADYGVPQTRERCIIVARRDGGPITWPMPTHTETAGLFTQPWVTMAEALGWGDGCAIAYSRGAGMNERHGERHPHPFNEPAPTISTHAEKDYRVILNYRQTRPTADGGTEPIIRDVTDIPCPAISTQSQSQWVFSRPATTIAGDMRVFQPGGHHQPGEQSENAIRLTIPELAKLQGFPDNYIWTGTKTAQARQIGNAVPPALAEAVARVNRPLA
jgi:DNA (cytosine-5)-methyltransferase 1